MEIIITDFASHESSIRHVRDEVFIREQQISRDDELDDRDAHCAHVLGIVDGQPIGTGRIDLEKRGKVGRVAVLQQYRRHGVGKQLMQALERYASEKGLPSVWFHAQISAVPFYISLGYQARGEEFVEAGIRHVEMEKVLGN